MPGLFDDYKTTTVDEKPEKKTGLFSDYKPDRATTGRVVPTMHPGPMPGELQIPDLGSNFPYLNSDGFKAILQKGLSDPESLSAEEKRQFEAAMQIPEVAQVVQQAQQQETENKILPFAQAFDAL